MLSSVACCLLRHSFILSHEWHDFQEKVTELKMHFFLFSLEILSERFLILIRIQQDFINVYRVSCVAPIIIVRLSEIWNFLTDFQKTFKYQNSWKSIGWQPNCSMRADGWIDGQTGRPDKDNGHFFVILWMWLILIKMQLMFINIYEIGNKLPLRLLPVPLAPSPPLLLSVLSCNCISILLEHNSFL